MVRLGGTAAGAALIIIEAIVIGLAANVVNPHPLPWVRVPLRETRKMSGSREALRVSLPKPVVQNQEPVVIPSKPAAVPKTDDKPVVNPVAKHAPTPKLEPKAQTDKKPAPAKRVEALFTTLSDAKKLFDGKSAVFIDSRHKEDYDLEHVPGALSLYVDDLDKLYDGALGAVPKDKTLVTYCSDPQCETAVKLADALVARGHTRVFILLEGLPGWKDAGYATDKGEGK